MGQRVSREHRALKVTEKSLSSSQTAGSHGDHLLTGVGQRQVCAFQKSCGCDTGCRSWVCDCSLTRPGAPGA